jgi:transmembrane sensor
MVEARAHALESVRAAMRRRRQNARGWRAPVLMAASLIVALACGFGAWHWIAAPDEYATAFGERRMFTLADGSRISLDSASDVTVRYTRTSRELHLLHGQARFDVAHDVQRPFSVLAGNETVVATGTAFNIDMTEPDIRVTLIEGHVVVFDEKAQHILRASSMALGLAPASLELRAGQQLIVPVGVPPRIEAADVQRVTAWTSGQLIFSNEPLFEVVARVNRYSTTPIVVADPAAAHIRVTGVFNIGDVQGFIAIVTEALPLKASSDAEGDIRLSRKS